VRACTPAPGAWTTYDGERLKLGPVTPADGAVPPREVVAGKKAVVVGTGTGALRLGEVQAVGKRPMAAADWARGLRLSGGEVPAEGGARGSTPTLHSNVRLCP